MKNEHQTTRRRRRKPVGKILILTLLLVVVLGSIILLVNRKYDIRIHLAAMARQGVTESASQTAASGEQHSASAVLSAASDASSQGSAASPAETAAPASDAAGSSASDAERTSSAAAVSENSAAASDGAQKSESVSSPDTASPVIKGADPAWVEVGSTFSVMDGITVSDDTDPSPVLSADKTDVSTSKAGVTTTITYTASDASGNSATALRRVHVVKEFGKTEDGVSFPIYWDTAGISGQPYLAAVNSAANCVTVYEMDDSGRYTVPVKSMICSVGSDTPAGYFRTEERSRWKELFESSYGQYAIRITGHILFHSVPYDSEDPSTLQTDEYNLLGTSASHGCVRLTAGDEKWLYDNCPDGFPCVIYSDEDNPGPLGKPVLDKIDVSDSRASWDPTDPDPSNPWLTE